MYISMYYMYIELKKKKNTETSDFEELLVTTVIYTPLSV